MALKWKSLDCSVSCVSARSNVTWLRISVQSCPSISQDGQQVHGTSGNKTKNILLPWVTLSNTIYTAKYSLHQPTADDFLCEHVSLESKKSSFLFNIWRWHKTIFAAWTCPAWKWHACHCGERVLLSCQTKTLRSKLWPTISRLQKCVCLFWL